MALSWGDLISAPPGGGTRAGEGGIDPFALTAPLAEYLPELHHDNLIAPIAPGNKYLHQLSQISAAHPPFPAAARRRERIRRIGLRGNIYSI